MKHYIYSSLLGNIHEECFLEYKGELYIVLGAKGYVSHDYKNMDIHELTSGEIIILTDSFGSGDDFTGEDKFTPLAPFIKYLLGTILAAYKDFGDRFALVEEKLPAVEMVRKATMNKIGRFTKQDIRELCPSLSLSTVEGALRKMVAAGELKHEGKGKSTHYIRLK